MFKYNITAEIFSSSEFPTWLTEFQDFLIDGGDHGTAALVSTEEVLEEGDGFGDEQDESVDEDDSIPPDEDGPPADHEIKPS